jgi:hypothetical protein
MLVPRKTMEDELKGQEKELVDDINSLNKKVSQILSGLQSSDHLLPVKIPGEAIQRRADSAT